MKTLIEILALSCEFLRSKGVQEPRRDMERLIAHILGLSRLDLYLQHDRPLQESELQGIREGVRRLSMHEPIQYIEGEVLFHNCAFLVNRSVLIPRPETEILVEMVFKYFSKGACAGRSVLDLCTGSGCIGISIKKELPELEVVLVDNSREALKVAAENAKKNTVEVELLESDLFEKVTGRKFDCIVSNPPYISQKEYEVLDKSVLYFEPQQALLAGSTGLEYYDAIARQAGVYLKEGGILLLEIGASQGSELQALFRRFGYANSLLQQDFSGRDRFLTIFS